MRDSVTGDGSAVRYRVQRVGDMEVTLSAPHPTDYPVHVHNVVECLLIVDGRSRLIAGDCRFDLGRGDLVVIAPGEPHAGEAPNGASARFLSVQFPARGEQGLLPGSHWHARVIRNNRAAHAVCDALIDADGRCDVAMTAHVVAGIGEECLRQVSRRAETSAAPLWLLDAWSALLDGGQDPDDLSAFAARFGVSASHFSAVFKKYFGLAPRQLMIALRIDRVREALSGEMPLAQIATEHGFSDQSHLNRHFLRRYPMPPGRFRKNLRLS
ncbi:MAG: AraC family transcriptional regulator [Pseudomonadota bacterium]